MNRVIIALLISFVTAGSAFSQKATRTESTKMSADCKKCHSCDQPTKSNPCLDKCPKGMTMFHKKAGTGPASITMATLSPEKRMYPPVVFSHKAHAEMAQFSGECNMCHHYNPGTVIAPCKTCHEENRKRVDISKPDLKGAFHRQCMDCHQTWSHNSSCEQCHGKQQLPSQLDKQKRMHPETTEPGKVVVTTKYKNGKMVTFYHNQHTDLYNIECQSCHTNETCVRCHDKEKSGASVTKTLEEKHSNCSKCHSTQSRCEFCHTDAPQAAFDHAKRTGWTLSRFHSKLTCNSCHKTAGKFAGLSRECATCHKQWAAAGLDHTRIGLKFDETHAAFECADCHTAKDYAEKSCKKCHDDKSWPKDKPGQAVKGSTSKKSKSK